ncbi:MAG TPA: hypothetical protein VMT81_02185 [Candidatus Paceibacterota bacterium]|nr:hypothetical protein [Candidatus Paceibacterota bacterium]
MNLFETLEQLKTIQPDPAFRESSKRAILATAPREPWRFWRRAVAVFETGAAVALTVFFVLVLTGQFPNSSSPIAPVQFSVIDPATLRAEAQAVDIQIQLADVAYDESSTAAGASTAVAASGQIFKPLAASLAAASSTGSASSSTSGSAAAASSTASSTPISVDQALQQLAQ